MVGNFALTPEQHQLKSFGRAFATEVLTPLAAKVRRTSDPKEAALLVRPAYEAAVANGLIRGMIPPQFGGTSGSGVDAAILFEELAVAMPDFVTTIGGLLIAGTPIFLTAPPEQAASLLAPFLAQEGAPTAVMAFSEPRGSANFDAPPPAAGVQTRAVADGDEWVINGEKQWASHLSGWDGTGPDLMLIVCRTEGGVSIIAAQKEHFTPGTLEVVATNDLPGLRGALTQHIRIRDLRVPRTHLIGREGQGAELTYAAFTTSAAAVGVFAVASMRAAFEHAHRFAVTESRGGPGPVISHRPVADALSAAKGRIEAVRFLSWHALDAITEGRPGALELALHAKVLGSETAVEVINDLMRVVGVQSYHRDSPIFLTLLDALAYPVFEGGNLGVRNGQLQQLLADEGWNPLTAADLV